jgi:hypothetical protein
MDVFAPNQLDDVLGKTGGCGSPSSASSSSTTSSNSARVVRSNLTRIRCMDLGGDGRGCLHRIRADYRRHPSVRGLSAEVIAKKQQYPKYK